MRLTWDITNKCNLRCKHCAAISLIEQSIPEYPNWKKVIDYVCDFVDSITLLGGEPLLFPEIEELIGYANSKNIKILIITNGQIDPKVLDNIMQHDITSILISMEGLEVTHDKIRGIGTWKKAYDSLNHLINLNKSKINKTQIGINIVANKLNRNEIIDIFELTKNLNIMYQVSSLSLKGNAQVNKDTLDMETDKIIDLFEEIVEYHTKNPSLQLNILNNYPIFKDYLNKKFGTTYNVKGFTCEALLGSIYADPYGNICVCQNHKDFNINIEKSNAWTEDFNVFEPFLKLLHSKNTNTICKDCKYIDECIPCPFNPNSQMPEFCSEILNRMNHLNIPLDAKYKLNKPYAIIESDDRYEIYYPNLGINTEYTIEGINILKSIKEFKSLKEISAEVSFPPEIVYEFLLQERKSSKVTELRDFVLN